MSSQVMSKIESSSRDLNAQLENFEQEKIEFQKIQSEYAEALQLQASLVQKLDELHAEIEAATLEFKKEFAAAHYERTPAVKKILQRKNDAQAMQEELEAALQKTKREIPLIQMDGVPKARSLLGKHAAIERTFVRLKMLEAMAAIPQEFTNALALAAGYFSAEGELNFVWEGLRGQARETGEKAALPFEKLSIAPFTSKDFHWTPLKIQQAKKAIEAGAAPDSIHPQRPGHGFFAPH